VTDETIRPLTVQKPWAGMIAPGAAACDGDPCAPRWDLGERTPVPEARFGHDHWNLLAYVETCAVDDGGRIGWDHVRVDPVLHPAIAVFQRRVRLLPSGAVPAAQRVSDAYPVRLKSERPGADGVWGVQELRGVDEVDCLDDLIRAGLLEPVMPRPDRERGVYLDPRGRTVLDEQREPIAVCPLTGYMEDVLMACASFRLTERGLAVAAALRRHKAVTGQHAHQFVAPGPPPAG